MHDFSGIAPVRLQQEGENMIATSLADWIAKNPLGSIAENILGLISGQRLAEAIIVGRNIAASITSNGIRNLVTRRKNRFLYWRQDAVAEIVELGVELLWLGVRQRYVVLVKQVIQLDLTPINGLFQHSGHLACRILNN